MPTAARRGPRSAPGSPSTTIAARTRRWPTGRRWQSGVATGNPPWTCRCAWTTLARCPHAHSRHSNNKRSWSNRSRKRCRLPPWETHPVASGTRTTAARLQLSLHLQRQERKRIGDDEKKQGGQIEYERALETVRPVGEQRGAAS